MDRRTLWAVMLMMAIAFIPTFFLKKPARPAAPSAAQVAGDTAAAPTPVTAAPGAAVAAPAGPGSITPSGPADSITVTTPLARYGVSTRGGVLTSLELERYKSTAPASKGAPVELVRPGAPLLGLVVITGSDTLHLEQWDFHAEPSNLSVTGEPASLTLTSAQAGHAVRIRYTFSPSDYQVGVSGFVTGVGAAGGQLVLGLGTGLANTEADSVENFRAAALVTYGGSAERHDLAKLPAGETVTFGGPYAWTALKSKYFVTAVLAFDSTGGRVSGVSATPLLTAGKRPTAAATLLRMPIATNGEFSYTLYAGPMEYDRLKRIGHDFDDVNPYGLPGLPHPDPLLRGAGALAPRVDARVAAPGLRSRPDCLRPPRPPAALASQPEGDAGQHRAPGAAAAAAADPGAAQGRSGARCRRRCSSCTRRTGSTRSAAAGPCCCPCRCCSRSSSCWATRSSSAGVPFLWFPDLARPDPYYIIPILSGISMFGLTKVGQMGIQHTAQTKMQAQMMTYMMPVMITIFGFNFASGLNLYWTVSNLASIPQQWLIARERLKLQKAEVKAFVEMKTRPVEEATGKSGRVERRRAEGARSSRYRLCDPSQNGRVFESPQPQSFTWPGCLAGGGSISNPHYRRSSPVPRSRVGPEGFQVILLGCRVCLTFEQRKP